MGSAITERKLKDSRCEAVGKAHGPEERALADADFDLVAFLDPEALRVRERHLDGVAPHGLGEGLRTFLQPGVVGEAAVPDAVVGDDVELQAGVAARGPRREIVCRSPPGGAS